MRESFLKKLKEEQNLDKLLIELIISSGKSEVDDLEEINFLLDRGANVNAVDDIAAGTVLMNAAFYANLSIFELLLQRGADITLRDNKGDTVLMYASEGSNAKVVARLFQLGVAADDRNNSNQTALICAIISAEEFSEKTVNLLLKNGADINAQDNLDRTALIHSIIRGGESSAFLISKGANATIQTTENPPATFFSIAEDNQFFEQDDFQEDRFELITEMAAIQRNKGEDWDQLQNLLLEILDNNDDFIHFINVKTAVLLTIIFPEGELRDKLYNQLFAVKLSDEEVINERSEKYPEDPNPEESLRKLCEARISNLRELKFMLSKNDDFKEESDQVRAIATLFLNNNFEEISSFYLGQAKKQSLTSADLESAKIEETLNRKNPENLLAHEFVRYSIFSSSWFHGKLTQKEQKSFIEILDKFFAQKYQINPSAVAKNAQAERLQVFEKIEER